MLSLCVSGSQVTKFRNFPAEGGKVSPEGVTFQRCCFGKELSGKVGWRDPRTSEESSSSDIRASDILVPPTFFSPTFQLSQSCPANQINGKLNFPTLQLSRTPSLPSSQPDQWKVKLSNSPGRPLVEIQGIVHWPSNNAHPLVGVWLAPPSSGLLRADKLYTSSAS